MSNTYTQVHIHAVFAVKYRDAVIHKSWQPDLYKYITGIVQNYDHKMLCINGVVDHVHMLFGQRPKQGLSDLMREVKEHSTKWINRQGFIGTKFQWQSGYGAFSYSRSQVPQVIQYIENQEEHHRKKTFLEEYEQILQAFEVDYDERYIFKPLE